MAAGRQRKVILPSGRSRRRLAFALTPLADAMFQLLIFFMLSSSLAPYSLLTLTPGQSALANAAPRQEAGAAPTIWNLSQGRVRSGTLEVPLSEIARLIRNLEDRGSDRVLVFAGSSATVQDIATVLNRLTLAGVESVELIAAEVR